MKKGTLCISLDTELIWGRVHLEKFDTFRGRAKKDWETIPKLLSLFAKYQIPVTWALTGHMFLDTCDGLHREIERPKYDWATSDWFKSDPGTDSSKNPEWYGFGLFKLIKQSGIHEVACHTFSHFFWGEKGCTKASAESDLQAWVSLAKKNNAQATSFVFPKNSVGHLDLLTKYGFTTYRGADRQWFESAPSQIRHLVQILDFLLPTSPSTVLPETNKKLINIPGSFYFLSARGVRKYIPKGIRAWKAKRGIDKAVKNGEIFHLWSHPIDFSDQPQKLLKDFEDILIYASKKVDEGKLEIKTMKQISLTYKN